MRLYLLLLVFLLPSCRGPLETSSLEKKVSTLQEQLREAKAKPYVIKYVDRYIPQESVKIVADTQTEMRVFKLISIPGMALCAGLTFFLSSIGLTRIGMAGFVGFATLFGISLTVQIAVPILLYMVVITMVVTFIGVGVYAIRHIDWKPHEKIAVTDLANGITDSAAVQKLVTSIEEAPLSYWQRVKKLWQK